MKKTLSLILAVLMLLGAFSITAFATTDNTTDITLTVAKALTYDMVIPEDVTNLNAAGIYSVGQAKATNVKNATDKTVISYTAETTAFKCEGKTDIPASYYTDEAGQNAFPTTAVEVYKNGEDAEVIPTMYVGISETDWNAAENGTYTATVTFNFEAKEAEPVPESCTITLGASPTSYNFKVNGENKTSFTVPGGSQIIGVNGNELTIQTPTGSYFNVICECPIGFDHWSLDIGDEIVEDITLIAWCEF